MAAVFLLLELNNIQKRKSQNPVWNRETYQRSFLFMAVFFLGWGFFSALIAKPFFPKWEQSACLLFLLIFNVFFLMKARIFRGGLLQKVKTHPYFRPFMFFAAIFYLGFTFMEYDPQKSPSIGDPFISSLVLGLLFMLIGMIHIAFYENGILLGLFLIPWKRVATYRWRPGYDARLLLTTNSLFFPYIECDINAENKTKTNRILLEKAPQADDLSQEKTIESEAGQSHELSRGPFHN